MSTYRLTSHPDSQSFLDRLADAIRNREDSIEVSVEVVGSNPPTPKTNVCHLHLVTEVKEDQEPELPRTLTLQLGSLHFAGLGLLSLNAQTNTGRWAGIVLDPKTNDVIMEVTS